MWSLPHHPYARVDGNPTRRGQTKVGTPPSNRGGGWGTPPPMSVGGQDDDLPSLHIHRRVEGVGEVGVALYL
jgi:hypothetical protein